MKSTLIKSTAIRPTPSTNSDSLRTDVQRDEVIAEHINSILPTVLISPSLHTGLDLKGELFRFHT